MENQKTPIRPRQFLSEDRAREFESTFAATIKLSGLVKDCLAAGDTEGAAYYKELDRRLSQDKAFTMTDAERAALHRLLSTETPKQAFDRLLYKTIAPALQDLYVICKLNKAPQEVSELFSVEPFEPGTIRNLIDRTLEEHPVSFLE